MTEKTNVQLSDDDMAFLIVTLRNANRPMTTEQLTEALREQAAKSQNQE